MRIGILTLPLRENYGGILQAYALQTYLTSLGHEVYVIDRTITIPKKTIVKKIKYIIKFILGRTEKQIRKRILFDINLFVDNNIHKTIKINDNDKFHLLDSYQFDTIIVGSDQVWRYEYSGNRYYNYFLDFVKNPKINKITYAASFGLDEWTAPIETLEKVKELIQKIDSISVREKSGTDICKNLFGVNAIQLIDPTLLFDSEFYEKLTTENKKPQHGVLCYILDNSYDKQRAIDSLKSKLNMDSFDIGIKYTYNEAVEKKIKYPSIDSWISGFKNASFVITDSFHGCLFSIIFKKQFVVYANMERGFSRFQSILSLLDLENRIIFKSDEIDNILSSKIDYYSVSKIIELKKQEVKDFFFSALKLKKNG